MESKQTNAPQLIEDVRERASKMPRNSTLLYRNKNPKDATSSYYRGLLKLENGDAYWCGLWVRRLGDERIFEIRLARKI
jgi:hypothetical protein